MEFAPARIAYPIGICGLRRSRLDGVALLAPQDASEHHRFPSMQPIRGRLSAGHLPKYGASVIADICFRGNDAEAGQLLCNPSFSRWNWFVSVEGFGLIHGREQDRMGVACFYNGLSNDLRELVTPAVQLEEVQGVELYYNAAITPWFHLTGDVQIVDNENEVDDTAIILGLRGKLTL
jgi:hypothetical protein